MKPDIVVGTAGHIDHGKTALVRALTGVDTDRLEEEKRRGITIDLGFAHFDHDGRRYGVVDVPGHEDFVRNMVAGASGIDVALLVVAADEGVMPQTREHLDIVRLLGVRRAVVALTKADLVEPAWLDLARDDVAELLAGTPYADADVVAVSARVGTGLPALHDALAAASDHVAPRSADDVFRMPVDRVFSVRGTGTVVTGTVWSGRLDADASVRVLPGDAVSRVRGLQRHHESVDRIGPGVRAAVALTDLDAAGLHRGQVLVDGPGWGATSRITARVDLLPAADRPLAQRRRVRVDLGTAEVIARVSLLQPDAIQPGTGGWVQLRLEQPLVCRALDRFVLRDFSPVTTVGGGTVLEPRPERRRRSATDVPALERALADPAERVRLLVESDDAGIPLASLPILLGVAPAAVPALIAAGDVIRVGERIHDAAGSAGVAAAILDTVDRWHAEHPLLPGIPHAELLNRAARGEAALVGHALQGLVDDGRLSDVGGAFARNDFQAHAPPAAAAALEALRGAFEEAGLESRSPEELAPLVGDQRLADLLDHLSRNGTIRPFPGGRWISSRHLAEARRRVRRELGGRTDLTPGDFRDLFGLSRRHLIPLLELFDADGTTKRGGDVRQVPVEAEAVPPGA